MLFQGPVKVTCFVEPQAGSFFLASEAVFKSPNLASTFCLPRPHSTRVNAPLVQTPPCGRQDVEDMVYGKCGNPSLASASMNLVPPHILRGADRWQQKQKQQQDANADAAAGIKKKKVTAAQLRVQKGIPGASTSSAPFLTDRRPSDLSELALPSTMKTDFPDPDDTLNFTLTIEPDEGMYKGGRFHFTFAIPQSFPHEAPKVKCTQKIYHPNIDLEGNVCLNILREDWKPVLNLQAVIIGLQVRTTPRQKKNPSTK
jgi:ubiquitin-conjugating enzyme E2 M